jgi:hypothetical protein
MSKHRKKKEVLTIDQSYAIISAASNLMRAQEVAEISGDLEILLATSDRWINIYSILSEDKTIDNKIGFVPEQIGEPHGGQTDTKRFDESKGRPKIRKKSR